MFEQFSLFIHMKIKCILNFWLRLGSYKCVLPSQYQGDNFCLKTDKGIWGLPTNIELMEDVSNMRWVAEIFKCFGDLVVSL